MRPQVKKIVLLSIVFSLVGIVVLGASFYFLYMNGVQVSEERLGEIKVKLDEYQKKAAQVPAKKEELRQMRLRALKAQQQIPVFDENEFDRFLEQLRSMARSTGVQIKPPKAAQAKGGASEIVRATYNLTASGDFKKLWDFLKVLESSIRFVEIEDYNFTRGKESESKDSTTLTLKVSVFAFRSAAPPRGDEARPKEPEKFTDAAPQ